MKMAVPSCKAIVSEVYQEVMDDVVNNVRELFLEHGVDEEVLHKLKHTWETKFLETNVVGSETDSKVGLPKVNDAANGFLESQQLAEIQKETPIGQDIKPKVVLVKLMLSSQLESEDGSRALPIEVPVTALSGNQLFQVLTDSVFSAAKSLPKHLATLMLQQQVNAALNIQPQNLTLETIGSKSAVQQNDNADSGSGSSSTSIITQQKQVVDVSDDESDYHDVLEEAVIDVPDCDEDEMSEEDLQEESLGSDDDGSVYDAESTYESVIYCKYEKILISSSKKWKFHIKHGIMKLNGQEYVFQNANGAAQF